MLSTVCNILPHDSWHSLWHDEWPATVTRPSQVDMKDGIAHLEKCQLMWQQLNSEREREREREREKERKKREKEREKERERASERERCDKSSIQREREREREREWERVWERGRERESEERKSPTVQGWDSSLRKMSTDVTKVQFRERERERERKKERERDRERERRKKESNCPGMERRLVSLPFIEHLLGGRQARSSTEED